MELGAGRRRTGRPKKGSPRSGRNRKLCIRISEEDLRLLSKLCDRFDITKSDYIALLIREGAKRLNGDRIR